jgi:hypothetical protein
MRKHPGKTIARIFDFVVIPEDGDTPESLKQVELRRVAEFAELAVNRVEVERKIQGITQGEG